MSAPMVESGFSEEPRWRPHNIEAEQDLLGLILSTEDAIDDSDGLLPEHFYEGLHGRIYAKCQELRASGSSVRPVSLKDYFEHDEDLARVGGIEYLARLAANSPIGFSATQFRALVAQLVELSQRRNLIYIAEIAADRAADYDSASSVEICEDLQDDLRGLSDDDLRVSQPVLAYESAQGTLHNIEEAMKNPDALLGLECGIGDLDQAIGGFEPQQLIVIGGRPGMGKSTLGSAIGVGIARNNGREYGVGEFSLEMSANEWNARMLTEMAYKDGQSIAYERARRGRISGDEMTRLIGAGEALRELPLWIDDEGGRTMASIFNEAHRLKRRFEAQGKRLGGIVIDQLTHIRSTGAYAGQKVNELAEITAACKALAKQLDCFVVLLHQLSRGVEGRDDKRPVMSDFRDSGSIEQDADTVIFVYREAYYLQREEPEGSGPERDEWLAMMDVKRDQLEAIIGKRRMGPTGTVRLFCDIASGFVGDQSAARLSAQGGFDYE